MSVIVSPHPLPFTLLEPGYHPARLDVLTANVPVDDVVDVVAAVAASRGPVALDLETCGTDPVRSDSEIVMVGVGCEWGSAAIDLRPFGPETSREILHDLVRAAEGRLIAHNAYFDSSFLRHVLGYHPQWLACTYALYKHLASEGFEGQRWGLKEAQRDLLGWAETNEPELDEWLVAAGHGDSYVDKATGERILRPRKGEMWRAPAGILGRYCALDCESTYLLYTEVLAPQLAKFPELRRYHQVIFARNLEVLIEQRLSGISIDVPALTHHGEALRASVREGEAGLRTVHRDILQEWRRELLSEHLSKEPPQFRAARVGAEPPRYRKDGSESTNWLKWAAKAARPPVERADWTRWVERRLELETGTAADQQWNPSNPHHRRWLLYAPEALSLPVFETTEKGFPATGDQALRQMGAVGAPFLALDEAVKELTYVTSYISLTNPETGCLHPGFSVPGTLTHRLGGREPNIQQVPKTFGTMNCFVPRPGTVWVDFDWSSIEPTVLAELSRDPGLWSLFGPGAPKNDVYLYVGSQLPGRVGEQIRATGYDPFAPTAESVTAGKKGAKAARQIAKTVHLALGYGAAPRKVQRSLRVAGHDLSLSEVEDMHEGYWQMFRGVKEYEAELQREWRRRRGWVMGPLGLPIPVADALVKDLVNRVVQKTAHDIHMLGLYHLTEIFREVQGPEFVPVIADWHDQLIVEVHAEWAELTQDMIQGEMVRRVNEELGGEIQLWGEATICRSLSDAKSPER